MPPPPPPPPLFPYTTLFRSGAAQPVSLPLAEFRPERLSRPPEPVLRAHAPDRPRADGTVSRLLLRTRGRSRSEEHTSELQSHHDLVCRLLLEKKKKKKHIHK